MLIVLKALVSGAIVALASETAKRFPLWGAILVSVPLTSLLTAIWLKLETNDHMKIAKFLENVFWAHIPTLLFFILCPLILKNGVNFWIALTVSLAATTILFFFYATILRHLGIHITD